MPAVQVVEWAFGLLEVHHDDKGQVLSAGDAVLEHLGITEADSLRPKVVSNQIICSVEAYQAHHQSKQTRDDAYSWTVSVYTRDRACGLGCDCGQQAEKSAEVN